MRAHRGVQVVVGVKEDASVSLAPQLALPKVPRVAAFQLKSCIAARHHVEREQAAIVAACRCHHDGREHRGLEGLELEAAPEERSLKLEDRQAVVASAVCLLERKEQLLHALLALQRSQQQQRPLGAAGQWPGGPAAALEVATVQKALEVAMVLEVAVAGEEMAMVVLREVVVMWCRHVLKLKLKLIV
jgi:hypothetical protein